MSEDVNEKVEEAEVVVESAGITPDERNMGLLCVLSQFLNCITGLGGLIVPLIIWLIKKDSSAYLDQIGKETVNFQITLLILMVICWLLCFIFIGLLLLPIVGIYALVVIIIAAIKANQGIIYRYPVCFRFIK